MSILVIIYYGKRKLQYPKSIALKIKSYSFERTGSAFYFNYAQQGKNFGFLCGLCVWLREIISR
jgi:hypothetical protein